MVRPFRKGQAVWTYVNGEPGLRYYVEPHNHQHVLSFLPDLKHPVLYEVPLLWHTKAGVLNWMIEGIESRLGVAVEELLQRRKQLAAEWPNDPSSATRRTGRVDCNRDALAGFAAAHG